MWQTLERRRVTAGPEGLDEVVEGVVAGASRARQWRGGTLGEAEGGQGMSVAQVGGLCCADGAGKRGRGAKSDGVGLSRVLAKRVEAATV